VVIGSPAGPLFAAGADEVVVPGEPELLFRRLRGEIERLDLLARWERMSERVAAVEAALADAAHDVRSPLQSVIGNAELLARDDSLTGRQQKSAEAIARQGLRALHLAEGILDHAQRRERGSIETLPVELGKLVESAVSQAATHARSRSVSIVAVPPPRPVELRADPDLLARLLDNLIANAVHASPRNSTIEVSAWRASPKSVCVAVKDEGEGIAPGELPRLVAGLGPGRGLRICRDIAERHGGELWAESTPGKGTRFLVGLPLQPPSTRPRVLLVSDDTRWLREVGRTLKIACEVRSSSIAAAKLGSKRTDLVLVEAPVKVTRSLEALRTAAKGAQVPFIELPSEVAAERLARTLSQLAP
jgi:signal transduction histidine kinase